MIKRTLYFGNNAYLHTKNKQLVIDFPEKEKESLTVPIEDIGVVILDAYQLTISQNLISRLLDNNVALITCNSKRMPQGLMLNLEGNTIQQQRFKYQIDASVPFKKQLWQHTIKSKIENQRSLLIHQMTQSHQMKNNWDTSLSKTPIKEKDFENMQYWKDSVKSGDPDNYEARAAVFYWKTIFADIIPNFKRGRFEFAPNNLLNYGYAILRATVARSLVAAGLLPTLGINHHNKYNAYALADDIMEPYRPYVDEIVRGLVEKYYSPKWEEEDGFELSTEIKAKLLVIPALDVVIDGQTSPLMIATQRTASSLNSCFMGESRRVLYPVL